MVSEPQHLDPSDIGGAQAPPQALPTPWGDWGVRHGIAAALLLFAAVGVTGEVWGDILHIGLTDEESSHILLVGIALPWLAWSHRERFQACQRRGTWVGPLLVALGWGVIVFGYDQRYDALWRAGCVMVAVGGVLSVLGIEVLVRFLPVFAALAFLVPVPWPIRFQIAMPLQTAMATVTEQVGQVLGLVVSREGNVLVVNGRAVEIAEACNGMRMVFGLFLVAYTFAFVTPLRTGVRVLILIVAPLFALACNLVRMVPTVWMYGHLEPATAERFHDAAGWLMILVGVAMLMALVETLRWAGLPVFRASGASEPQDPTPARGGGAMRRGQEWLVYAATALLLVGLAGSLRARQAPDNVRPYHARVREQAERVPMLVGEWYGRDEALSAQVIQLLKPNVMISRRYENLRTSESFLLLVVHCDDARHLAGHYPPICYPAKGWVCERTEPLDLSFRGRTVAVTEYGFREDSFNRARGLEVVNYMFLPTGKLSPDMGAVHELSNHPFLRFYGAGQVQLVFDPEMGAERRREIVGEFFGALSPLIEEALHGIDPQER